MNAFSEKYQKILKYTGCYCLYTLLFFTIMIWTVGLMVGVDPETINLIWGMTMLFIIFSMGYYILSAPDDKETFFKKLQKKGIKEAKINCGNLKSFSVPKQTGTCPFYPKKIGPMEFTTSFYYLCEESVTIYTKCAKFHIFRDDVKVEKKKLRTVKTKKESCEEIYEFYYYNINYINYEKKQILFYFNNGKSIGFDAEKKPAKKVIEALRQNMRESIRRKTIHAYGKAFPVELVNMPESVVLEYPSNPPEEIFEGERKKETQKEDKPASA